MTRELQNQIYRCDLCHGTVDAETRDRARRVWQPLIICDGCVLEPDRPRAATASLPA
jgi:hypothetical protein